MSESAFFSLPNGETAKTVRLIAPVAGGTDFHAATAAQLAEIRRAIDEHQERQKHFYSGSMPEQLRWLIGHYHDLATAQLRRTKEFRDDVMIHLRALGLVIEMAGNAATHAEKNARLRGAAEVIGGAISTLRKERFEIGSGSSFPFDDVFRSDYPTRELLYRIHELEAENRRLRGEGESQVQPPDDGEEKDIPF